MKTPEVKHALGKGQGIGGKVSSLNKKGTSKRNDRKSV